MTTSALDRVHFLEAQRRNRRRSLRFMVFAVLAVALAGIPVCVLVAPLLFGVALVAAHMIDLVAPLGDVVWGRLHDLAFALPTVWARIRGRPVEVPWTALALLYVVPGALLMLVTWPFVALLSRRAGAGALLDRLPSRAPDPSVLAEQQLINVAQEMAGSVPHACSIMLVHIPLVATLGLAVIAARQAIGVFTTLVLGPWLAAMWRARRRLADATAVQLTRNPGALAWAVRKLESGDVEVPGGWAVNFLFPVWPAVTEEIAARQTEVAVYVVGMRLEPAGRLERLAALGATLEAGAPGRGPGLVARVRGTLPDRRELGAAIGWGLVAIVGAAVLVAVTLAAASLLLMGLWYLLRWITAAPRWLRWRLLGAATHPSMAAVLAKTTS